MPKTA